MSAIGTNIPDRVTNEMDLKTIPPSASVRVPFRATEVGNLYMWYGHSGPSVSLSDGFPKCFPQSQMDGWKP